MLAQAPVGVALAAVFLDEAIGPVQDRGRDRDPRRRGDHPALAWAGALGPRSRRDRLSRATASAAEPVAAYLAYSTARVSRMTVTLIWPG